MAGIEDLFRPFFHPDATLTITAGEDIDVKVDLPDGRVLKLMTRTFGYENPNAKKLPPFDFRDQLGKKD